MKKFLVIIIGLLLFGCVAHVTPEGTYIEPLPAAIFIGPPVIVPPPPHIVVEPLPPVVLSPERHIYHYHGLYYYHWKGDWYYGEREKGPWYRLPKKFYPPRERR
jgi:hypothetical protein